MQSILGNGAIGQCEQQDFELLWIYHSLVRVDFYCWRYNFSAKGLIGEVENVFAYIVIKRVLDWKLVDPPVITYCISKLEMKTKEVEQEIDDVTELIGKIKSAAAEHGKMLK